MTFKDEHHLAAVIYEAGEGPQIDAILATAAAQLCRDGWALAGTVQRSAERADRCRCDMIVVDLASGSEMSIFEDRGPEARGCRLDPAALERLVAMTLNAIDRGADLVIINRFGKQEAEGRGFRHAIAEAMQLGIPTVTVVARANIDAWRQFAGGYGIELMADAATIISWCRAVALARRASLSEPAALTQSIT